MNNADMPISFVDIDDPGFVEQCRPMVGLTKREYFAGLALTGMCADIVVAEERGYDSGPEQTARDAVKYADALLAELERTKMTNASANKPKQPNGR
jgi:hypothetical protein